MTEPVFCGQCKHRQYNSWGSDKCVASPAPAHNWHSRFETRADCHNKNAENDCPDFEASWWTRVKRLLGGT